MNNAGVKIVLLKTGTVEYLRAYNQGVFVEQTATNPTISEKGLFIQRWF